MSPRDQKKQTNIITGHLQNNISGLIAIYSYGSWGTKYERPSSDIDLAILINTPIKVLDRLDIAQDLARKLGKDVELVDLKLSPTVLQAEIITKGSRLYCKDSLCCDRFENFVFSSYARLNEERSGILEDIRKRGSVYG